jgi:protein-tyrosine phosphatase
VGAQVVVCLCERFELEERYPEYSQWLSAHAGGAARMFPVPDLHAPSVDEARAITGEVAGLLTSGRSVLMHCGAGMGRAGTMAAAVLMSAGVDLDDALHVVAASRPGAGPEAGAQMELLLALQTPEPGA